MLKKIIFLVVVGTLIFTNLSTFALTSKNYLISNIISEWNAINTQGNQVFDSSGQNAGTLNGATSYFDNTGQVFSFASAGNNITIPDSPSLNPQNALTITTWIRGDSNNKNAIKTLLSKYSLNQTMTATDITSMDVTDLGGPAINRGNFTKPVFDGRYIYSISMPASGNLSTFIRYDTQKPFSSTTAWNSVSPYMYKDSGDYIHWYSGYSGSVYDGRYIYLVPNNFEYESGRYHGFVLRYDTQGPLNSAPSWSHMDIRTLDGSNDLVGFQDGLFDGRYVYFTGGGAKSPRYQKIARYDTTLDFKSATSWSYVSMSSVAPTIGNSQYYSMIQAGSYIYFIPNNNGTFVQYNTNYALTDPAGWTVFDASNTGGKGVSISYVGGTYDGRYVYFSPSIAYSESMLRYDSTQSFNSSGAWSTHSVKEPASDKTEFRQKAYSFAGFDGRYVYYYPYQYTAFIIPQTLKHFGGKILRYDTTQDYNNSANAWSQLDMSTTYGVVGAVTDHRYFYMVSTNPSGFRAVTYRLDTSSNTNFGYLLNQTSYASGGQSGLNFAVSTSDGYFRIFSNRTLTAGWHLVTGVYDGSSMSLYLDSNLLSSIPATGILNQSPANLLIGSSVNGSYYYSGDLNKAGLYSRGLSLSEIQRLYQMSPYGGCS